MDELIYNQKKIPKKQWRYGFRSSAAVGCGWIATYNALLLLGHPAKPEKLIRSYERMVPLLHGNIGTYFWGPALYFKLRGFPVKLAFRKRKFDRLAKESDVCILFYRWRNKWRLGAHFVALRHTQEGFIGYNTYTNSTGPDRYGESLTEYLKRRKYFGGILIGIKNKGG